jgi:AcrR family transcriptional regulator
MAAAAQAAGESRERILRAALQTFAEKGFDGGSTREIASGAGVNHGLIPYYFGSKEKLWRACVDRAFQQIESGLGALLSDPSIRDERDRAARLIRAHVQFVARNPEFVRLMHDEGKRRGPRMRWIVDRHVKPMYAAITSLLERGRSQGALSIDMPPVHFFYVVVGAVSVIFHQAEECKRVSGVDPFDPQVVENHARAIEQLLLGPRP